MESKDEKSKLSSAKDHHHTNLDSNRERGYSHHYRPYNRDGDKQGYSRHDNREVERWGFRSGTGNTSHGYHDRHRYTNNNAERRQNSRKRSHSRERDRNRSGNSYRDNRDRDRPAEKRMHHSYRPRRDSFKEGQSSSQCDTNSIAPPKVPSSDGGHGSGSGEEDLRPISLNINCPAATTLVKQIEQRKLIFSKKDKPVAATAPSVWQQTTFSDDSDGKVSAKFKRLMGMKDGGNGNRQSGTAAAKPTTAGTQSKDYFVNLEKQYEVARTITHTQRGVGLGFGGSLPKVAQDHK